MFRVVIFSSGLPSAIAKLARRIHSEVPEAQVCGVLLERRPGKTLGKRISTFATNIRQFDFVKYAAGRVAQSGLRKAGNVAAVALRFTHAGSAEYPREEGLDGICPSLITTDCHSWESLDFVRSLDADLGLVYGTRILKPCLFRIPRLGSINIHKRKVPDYRGGGPVGLWELLDGQPEIGITVHQVEEQLDAGAVINAATIPIQPFDTLSSLALKAQVIANDLLVRSVADYVASAVNRQPQHGESRMFKNPSPQLLARYENELALRRANYRAVRGRPPIKLLARSVAGIPFTVGRNWRRRLAEDFPVMILFHHLVSDRPHGLGMSTDHFVEHVEFLRRFYQIAPLSEAIEMLRTNAVKRPTVVLTVDDGYADNLSFVLAPPNGLFLPIVLK